MAPHSPNTKRKESSNTETQRAMTHSKTPTTSGSEVPAVQGMEAKGEDEGEPDLTQRVQCVPVAVWLLYAEALTATSTSRLPLLPLFSCWFVYLFSVGDGNFFRTYLQKLENMNKIYC